MPLVRHPRDAALGLVYVGISPARKGSRGTVRRRVVGQHLRGNTSSSTFRLVLAALLREELALTPRRRGGKVVLDAADNDCLSTWQHEHLRLTWCVRERPWEVEDRMIELMEPPLNAASNAGHRFFPRVREARAAFRAAALDR